MGKRLIGIYFSATDTTRKYVRAFSDASNKEIDIEINLADNFSAQLPDIAPEDLVIVAAPVYGGRLPSRVSFRLKELKGNQSKAIAMVVYGNRDYDDALLELTDILSDTDFEVIGAGAFIGRHSIFPKVASSRPDNKDMRALSNFANECLRVIETGEKGELKVKGNRPYKKAAGVPLHPSGDSEVCNRCGKCVEKCPVDAIKAEEPYLTDGSICISCGRCIYVCPRHTRKYSGLKYKMIGSVFTAAFSKRKEAEFTVI